MKFVVNSKVEKDLRTGEVDLPSKSRQDYRRTGPYFKDVDIGLLHQKGPREEKMVKLVVLPLDHGCY